LSPSLALAPSPLPHAPAALNARAPAKINLSLHVRGRRADGYHDLESLVVFAGTGDGLTLIPGSELSLVVTGPTAGDAGALDGNLVLRAARRLAERRPGLVTGRFSLVKRLPVAAGLGGGSSDAAAALRLLARANGILLSDPVLFEVARETGSDVPVCLAPGARMMRGAGELLGSRLAFPRLFAVLVNPRVAVETPAVFAALGLARGARTGHDDHPDMGEGDALASLAATRNDLERPAIAVAPIIADVLDLVRGTNGLRLARMSGSGATCFGVYEDCRSAASAAAVIQRARPDWWVKPTVLR
jgi:4-diphosphocytidyl-2-C-methyl-D-erythritol kinase